MTEHDQTEFVDQHYDRLCEHFAMIHEEEYAQYCHNEEHPDLYEFVEDHEHWHDFIWYEYKNWLDDRVDEVHERLRK